jgi:hypothetical protein
MVFVVLGALTLPIAVWLLVRGLAAGVVGGVPSFVFGNVQRLPHEIAVGRSATAYPLNVGIIVAWLLVVVLYSVHAAALLRQLWQRAQQATLVAATFLAGATILGVVIGLSILKVSEFAVQSMLAAPGEQAWLRDGITYMNQLHLFYVHSWIFCMAVGWITVGAAAAQVRHGRLVLAAGAAVAITFLARVWLPVFGPTAPGFAVLLSDQVMMVGVAAGWLGSGLLGRSLGQVPQPAAWAHGEHPTAGPH